MVVLAKREYVVQHLGPGVRGSPDKHFREGWVKELKASKYIESGDQGQNFENFKKLKLIMAYERN
jgi:hypothetical protein